MKPLIFFLVDDDPEDVEIFGYALEHACITCSLITASSGIDALEQLSNQNFSPDYIFLDLVMPGMGGKKCLQAIREISRLKEVPVIICSTSNYMLDDENVLRSNATHFYTKPGSVDDLAKILKKILERDIDFFVE
jgi:CheY-like chemotaxis protein